MFRIVTLCASLLFIVAGFGQAAQASDTCARATGGKCKFNQTAPPAKAKAGNSTRKPQQATGGARLKNRDQYTAAEREKIMERAREICRKNYGAPSRVYRIDYAANKVWCEPPSY